MNKSKFLKKSLAALLAVMLVVAMIPLSAAADTVKPVVDKVTVNGQEATLSGETWTAELIGTPTAAPTIEVTLHKDIGYVAHNNADVTRTNGTYTFAMTADEFEAGTATFLVYEDDETTTPTYTYKVTYTVKDGAENVGVSSVTATGQYGATSQEGKTYTITLPYGTASLAANAIKVVLSDKNATIPAVTGGASSATAVTGEKGSFTLGAVADITTDIVFTVVAEDGVTTQDYTIKMQVAGAFKSFSVDGERKAAKIDTTTKKITVYMPFDTKSSSTGKWQFTPSFEMVYPSAAITATKNAGAGGAKVTIASGNKVELSEFTSAALGNDARIDTAATTTTKMTLTVEYTNGTDPWTLEFATPQYDPEPVLKALRVDNYAAVIDETAKTVTLTLPASKRVTSGTLTLTASPKTNVLAVGTTKKKDNMTGDGTDTITAFDLSEDRYTLRVTAAGDEDGDNAGTDKKEEDYKFFINTAKNTQPSIDEFKLEDPNGKQYTATISEDGTILFDLPYSYTKDGTTTVIAAGTNLADWKLYYALSEGSGCSTNLANIPSGTKLTSTAANFWPGNFDGKAVGTAIEVKIDDKTYKNYSVAVKQGNPSTDTALTNFKITQLDGTANKRFADIKDGDNAFAATGTKDLTVTVPYSKYNSGSYATGSIVSATLPAGASLYYIDSEDDDKLVPLTVLDEYRTTQISSGKLPSITTYKYDGVTKTSDKLTPLELVVVSQAGAKTADDNGKTFDGNASTGVTKANLAASLGRGGYATYTLTVKQDAAKTVARLKEFNVYDATTRTTIKGVVSANPANGITVTLPYGYDDANATGSVVNALYLDWSSENYETIALQKNFDGTADPATSDDLTTAIAKVELNSDGTAKSSSSEIKVTNATPATLKKSGGSEEVTAVKVTSEDTVNPTTVLYPVFIKFEKEKTEAKLTRVTIGNRSGTPDANNKVTITMPRSAEVTALKPVFTVSDGAFVSSVADKGANYNSTGVIKPDTQMNFTAPQTVYVYSENATNMTAYTIEVKVDDGFSDVKSTDWFYPYVMDASSRGIIIGNPDGTFNPNGAVTRVQFATMMARVDKFNASEWEGKSSQFSDMGSISGEAAAAVAYCADKGYITGDGGTTNFRPNDRISRQEMAVIITRVLKLDTTNVTVGTRFNDDARIAGWAKNYVYACANAGMLKGEGNNTFNPLGNTTRAAAATASVRVQDKKAK